MRHARRGCRLGAGIGILQLDYYRKRHRAAEVAMGRRRRCVGDARIAEAVSLAKTATSLSLSWGWKKANSAIAPSSAGRQEEMLQAIAATGRPVVVVIVGGSAVTMSSWLERVGAVLQAWYPGETGGIAVADVLFGAYNPAGRLPVTFPMAEGQLPLSYNTNPPGGRRLP